MKKIFIFISVLTLFITQMPFNAKAFNDEDEYKNSLKNIVSVIEDNLTFSTDGIRIKEKNGLIKSLNQEDINMLNKLSKQQGVELDKPYTKASLVRDLEYQLNSINENVEKNELEILDNGTLIDPNDKNFYIQGGSTYSERHWWGMRRYMSTYAATNYSYTLKDMAQVTTGLALASFIFGPYAVFPATFNGATALWANQLSNRIDYHNNRTSRGIIADLYWVLVFDIKTQ